MCWTHFSPLPAFSKLNRKSVNPFPSNTNWDVDPEANIPIYHFSKLAVHKFPGGVCCSNADRSFEVPPEVEFCWTTAWGACQVEHTELVSPWLCLSACFQGSRSHGVQGMAGLLPSFPSRLLAFPWFLCTWCLQNSAAWAAFFFLQVRSQALGMSNLTEIFFLQKSNSWPQKPKWSNLHFSLSKGEEQGTTPCQQSHPTGTLLSVQCGSVPGQHGLASGARETLRSD